MNFPHPEETRPLTERQPGYIRVSGRDGSHLVRKDATTPGLMLPGMPTMLAPEPDETAFSAAALRAMTSIDHADNAEVRAIGGAIRIGVLGALFIVGATFAWGGLYLVWEAVTLEMLPLAWLAAIVLTVLYALISEGSGRKYSAAGVELEKVRTAREMHLDRLEARQQMHHDAVQAWQAVLQSYLDREFRE